MHQQHPESISVSLVKRGLGGRQHRLSLRSALLQSLELVVAVEGPKVVQVDDEDGDPLRQKVDEKDQKGLRLLIAQGNVWCQEVPGASNKEAQTELPYAEPVLVT